MSTMPTSTELLSTASAANRPQRPFRLTAFALAALALVLTSSGLRAADAAPAEPGIDLAGIDRAVAPGDDFFAYANGGWLKRPRSRPTAPPGARSRSSPRRPTAAPQELIREAAAAAPAPTDADARKVGDFYLAFMDEAAIEAKGKAPLEPELAAIAALADKAALARYLGAQLRADVDPLNMTDFHTDRLFGLWVSPDFDNPSRNAAYLLQGGLGMPDRDNYIATDATQRRSAGEVPRPRRDACSSSPGSAGRGERRARRPDRRPRSEDRRRPRHAHRLDRRAEADNRWPIAEFPTRAPGLDWPAFFDAAGLGAGAKVSALMRLAPGRGHRHRRAGRRASRSHAWQD